MDTSQPQEATSPTQTQYDMLDTSIEILNGPLPDAKEQAPNLLRTWQQRLREAGLPEIAYELEHLEEAIRKADARQIRECLMKAGQLTVDASARIDGMMQKKILELGSLLRSAAGQIPK